MKKSILLLLALILVLSCSASLVKADDTVGTILTLKVMTNSGYPNTTLIAQLSPVPTLSAQIPVITFFIDGVMIGSVPINNLGNATLNLNVQSGSKHCAQAAWLNTTNPIWSNIVWF